MSLVIGFNSLLLVNSEVIWYTDNINVTRIIKNGSMGFDLQSLAVSIRETILDLGIRIFPKWIRRCFNLRADYLSKRSVSGTWVVAYDVFYRIDKVWGPHDFDRFADNLNSKCRKFNSEFLVEGSSGVNAFNFHWGGYNNWVAPPVPLVSAAIKHMQKSRCVGSLVIPKWKTASFWPLIVEESGHFRDFVKSLISFGKDTRFFETGRGNFFNNKCKFEMIIMRLDCT